MSENPVPVNVVTPPEVVVVSDMDGFLEKGQPVEAALSDDDVDSVTPLDLLSSSNYTDRETRDARLAVCKGCDRLWKPTRTCRECGCFMGLKTWLRKSTCPLDRWPDPSNGGPVPITIEGMEGQ